MNRTVKVGLAATIVALVAIVIGANVASPRDVDVPARLAGYIDPAREMARREAEPAGWAPMTLRLAQIGCSEDELVSIAAFEQALSTRRVLVIIQIPSEADAQSPGAATVIGLVSEHGIGKRANFEAILAHPCS